LINKIVNPLNEGISITNKLAEGDINIEIEERANDELGSLQASLKELSVNLSRIVGQIKDVSSTVASSSEEVSATTAQITLGIDDQAKQIDQSAAAIGDLPIGNVIQQKVKRRVWLAERMFL
jgi:methyl-accepting chemotaxis protein